MTLPLPRTVRARLVITTTIVMAIVLVFLGLVVDLAARKTLLDAVDSDLKNRGHDFSLGQLRRILDRRDDPDRPFPPFGGPPPHGPEPRFHMRDTEESRPRYIDLNPPAEGEPGPPREEPYDVTSYQQAQHGVMVYATSLRNGEPFRVYSEPVIDDHTVVGVVQVAYPLGDVYASLKGLRSILLTVVVPLGALLSGVASLFLVGRLLRPVRVIAENAESIGGGNLADRLPVVGADEFAGLAKTLNGMLERLENAFKLERETTQRLKETVKQQRRFTADASHELKTPLATIKAHTGLMLHMGQVAVEDREGVEAIDDAADRMNRLVGDLLLLARADAGGLTAQTGPVDLAEAASSAIVQFSGRGAKVELRPPPRPLVVQGNAEALTRMIVNLVDNALKYAQSPEPVEVVLARRGDAAELSVVDRGVGIAPEHLPRLFDRFYRPDTSRTSETGGTGLGLAICKEIAEAHGGTVEVQSVVGQGTRFTVTLPLKQ